MKFQQQIGPHQVVTYCKRDFAAQASSLFKTLAALEKRKPQLKDGYVLRFGWSDLTLRQEGFELLITEPDYLGDPYTDYLPQVTVTLEVLTAQVALLQKLGVAANDVYFRQRVIIAKGCLQKPSIYLERSEAEGQEDSGWFIGETEGDTNEDALAAIPVFTVYQERKELMPLLALPAHYLAVVKSGRIEAILNPENEVVFKG